MSQIDPSHRLDHLVVVMFENRSFDNLLGYLYPPGGSRAFEGVAGRSLSNPIPADAPGADRAVVPVHPAENMHIPDPDPGEEHPHVNTQLYGTVSPPENRFKEIDEIQAPFNAPGAPGPEPTMDGFVADYINSFRVEIGTWPEYEEYAQIMACYTPEQLPVLSALARGFACFDHWFCEVPSQTYANRSFFHAGSSSGFVLNGPFGRFARENNAPTIFERLETAGLPWRVYFHPEQLVSATGLIHARRLAPFFATHFASIHDFYEEAKAGKLPAYSFIEPNMFHPHTDMHPPGAARLRRMLHIPPPDSLIGGEQLLGQVYESIRDSSTEPGSNFQNTLLLVTFDEHGGTYDHVPPPRVAPPDPSAPAGEQGFRFDRSGVRIPTIAISAWIDEGTVINQEFRSTSVIRTLRERWSLGPPLTERDASAADISSILTRTTPRPPNEWPRVAPLPLGAIDKVLNVLERPLTQLERDLSGSALAHEANLAGRTLDTNISALSRREAGVHLKRIGASLFPRVARRPATAD
jgi:phospholipase C